MYPEAMVSPMRSDLTSAGFQELKTPGDVDHVLNENKDTVLLVVNSVCGCAAGNARPGVKLALKNGKVPGKLTTVFAGVDTDATLKARSYIPFPPSSPAFALFKEGKVVHFVPRSEIEGRPAPLIAEALKKAFDRYC